jgi:hypothetical protein
MSTTYFNPFLFYSNQLHTLLVKASAEKNPALWLHKNNVRTILFMLEGLTRLHKEAFDEPLFTKWYKRFKKLEDEFGQLDECISYDAIYKLDKKIPPSIKESIRQQINIISEKINTRLVSKDWLTGKILSFNVKLSKFTIEYNDDYVGELTIAISEEIKTINNFGLKLNYSFTQLEEEVHEMRRKLRWISIYGQALNGIIQLKPTTKKQSYSINYITKEIITSKYNKLAAKPKGSSVILFDKNSFLCLSWAINELGKLKDKGLKINFLAKEIVKVEGCTDAIAQEKALHILNEKSNAEEVILKTASNMIYQFLLKDHILDHLIVK